MGPISEKIMIIATFNKFILRHRYFIIFSIFLGVYFVTAYHLVFDLHHVFGDAVTRAEKPFLVLYDSESKLASLGFVWPPLPSLIQIPVLAIFKGLATHGFSSNLTTAVFGALNVVLIFRFLEKTSIARGWQIILVTIYALNPMIFFYAINGMSETIFLFFVILIAWSFFRWQENQRLIHLVLIGFSLLAAFLTRYETFVLIVTIAVLIFATVVLEYINFTSNKIDNRQKTSSLSALNTAFSVSFFAIVPAIFIVFGWMFVNWMIMDDPVYFFRGAYSVSEQSDIIMGEALKMSHNIIASVGYSMERIFLLFPIFLFLLFFLIVFYWRYSWRVWSMVLLSLAVPAFEILMHYLGKSFGWLRFFIYIIPFSFILISVMWYKQKKIGNMVLVIISGLLLVSSWSSILVMKQRKYGQEEFIATRAFLQDTQVKNIDLTGETGGLKNNDVSYDVDMQVVSFLKKILQPGEKVLVDDFIGFGIVLNYGDPKIFITEVDREYKKAVENPRKYADYVLIPSAETIPFAYLDIFNRKYPKVFYKGLEHTTLEKDFEKRWRLFRLEKL